MKESIRCRGLAAAVALGAALTAPAPAIAALPLRAKIVEGVGMGGVRLGMTERRVRSIWGPPGKFTPCQKLIGRADRACIWERTLSGGRGAQINAGFARGKLVYLRFRGELPWATTRGARVTTKLSRLETLYPRRLRLVATQVIDRCYVADLIGSATGTLFAFTKQSAAEGPGVDAIVIYDPRKVFWDLWGAPTAVGRPVARGGCEGTGPFG